ncbi:hypothetical protein SAMN04488539_0904 [Corynebacterium timonense]|uniref:Uncharacterized protein n=2 Tax=Corynebacterium timonense TaxID=441500 RepID=A0A1H1P102_9CORY|nr:hypothetical protein SAMN04488539_0904 [Corynebacterium timonense]
MKINVADERGVEADSPIAPREGEPPPATRIDDKHDRGYDERDRAQREDDHTAGSAAWPVAEERRRDDGEHHTDGAEDEGDAQDAGVNLGFGAGPLSAMTPAAPLAPP